MKDKKAIKREILDKFRSMNAENQETLPLHWLELVYMKKLRKLWICSNLYSKVIALK